MTRRPRLLLVLFAFSLSGCFNPADRAGKKSEEPPAAEDNAAAQGNPGQEVPAPAGNAEEPAPKPTDFAKLTWRLVDKKKAFQENPNLKIVNTQQMGGGAGDYLSAVSQAYVSARTRIRVMALQHDLDIQKELNDGKWPSFDQFQKSLRQSGVELENVYPWEVYAYDSEAGQILVLEDTDQKRKMRQEAGLPVD